MSKHKFSTERFDVFKITCDRRLIGGETETLPRGADSRDVYIAMFHSIDQPRVAATITLWPTKVVGAYVEWIDVTEHYRREGVATELLLGLEKYLRKELIVDGATPAGEWFEKHWRELKHPLTKVSK